MTNKIGNGSMPLRIGNLINTTVYGGPYRDVPEGFYGVKMAEEIKHPHTVSVPTKDFCVPEVNVLKAGIVRALMGMMNEEIVYVGCMGGIGRTGLFLAALAKVQIEYRKAKHRPGRGEDPVLYVRRHFIPHAVETTEQIKYIENFDVSGIVDWLDVTQTVLGLGGLTPVRTVEVTAHGDTERHFVPITPGTPSWIPEVETTVTGRIPRDPPLQNIKPAWIPEGDKTGNAAFDKYLSTWKDRRHVHHELEERDIDWMDAPDADSADELDNTLPTWEQFDSLQSQIDELQDQVNAVDKATIVTLKIVKDLISVVRGRVDNLAKIVTEDLTNAGWVSKIRSIFKK